MIDTHCHINDKKYESEINDIVLKAIDAGVKKMICVGVDLESSEKSIQIANNFEAVYASVGYHPHESKDAEKGYLYELEEMAKNPKVVAIGETGLDYHYNISPKSIQRRIFNEQIELSQGISLRRTAVKTLLWKRRPRSAHDAQHIKAFVLYYEIVDLILKR